MSDAVSDAAVPTPFDAAVYARLKAAAAEDSGISLQTAKRD